MFVLHNLPGFQSHLSLLRSLKDNLQYSVQLLITDLYVSENDVSRAVYNQTLICPTCFPHNCKESSRLQHIYVAIQCQ